MGIGVGGSGVRVCVIRQQEGVGGVSVNTGTIPSKALREAILRLVGRQSAMPQESDFKAAREATFRNLMESCNHVIKEEIEIVRGHLNSNGIALLAGTASFKDAKTVEV